MQYNKLTKKGGEGVKKSTKSKKDKLQSCRVYAKLAARTISNAEATASNLDFLMKHLKGEVNIKIQFFSKEVVSQDFLQGCK